MPWINAKLKAFGRGRKREKGSSNIFLRMMNGENEKILRPYSGVKFESNLHLLNDMKIIIEPNTTLLKTTFLKHSFLRLTHGWNKKQRQITTVIIIFNYICTYNSFHC